MAEARQNLHVFLARYGKWIIACLLVVVSLTLVIGFLSQRAEKNESVAMEVLIETDDDFNSFLVQKISERETLKSISEDAQPATADSDQKTTTEGLTGGSESSPEVESNSAHSSLRDSLLLIVEEYPNTFAQHIAQFRLGHYHWYNNDIDTALEFYLSSSKYKDSYMLPIVLLNLAAVYEENKDLELSKNVYQRITDDFKTHPAYPEALFNLGRLSEGENFDQPDLAKGYYQSIVADELWAESTWADLAKTRLLQFEISNGEKL